MADLVRIVGPEVEEFMASMENIFQRDYQPGARPHSGELISAIENLGKIMGDYVWDNSKRWRGILRPSNEPFGDYDTNLFVYPILPSSLWEIHELARDNQTIVDVRGESLNKNPSRGTIVREHRWVRKDNLYLILDDPFPMEYASESFEG